MSTKHQALEMFWIPSTEPGLFELRRLNYLGEGG